VEFWTETADVPLSSLLAVPKEPVIAWLDNLVDLVEELAHCGTTSDCAHAFN
jgi:hypothetical protein